jgi:MFS family permease
MKQAYSLSAKERWIYVVIAAVCMVATFPGRTHGLGLITEFVLTDLDIDRTAYGYYNLAATLIGSLFCIPAGSALDRYGCRKVLLFVLSALGISVLFMGAVNSRALFFIFLLFSRGFGQSALSVASMTLISKYFPKKNLGFAMGIYSVLTALFFIVAFSLMGNALTFLTSWKFSLGSHEITLAHWRIAWGSVGLILLFICVPLILLFVRSSKPSSVHQEEGGTTSSSQQGIPFSQAIRTYMFWIFALSISFFGLVNSGIALYNQDILSERGFDAQMYYFLLVLPLPFALASNLITGYLARYVKITYLLAFSLFFTGLGNFLFPFIQTTPQIYAYTVILAVSGGGLTVLFFIVWADVFGKHDVGRIQGAAQMMSVFASAIGPVFFAYSKEWTGSYTPAFLISGVLTLLFAIAACFTKFPKNSAMPEEKTIQT